MSSHMSNMQPVRTAEWIKQNNNEINQQKGRPTRPEWYASNYSPMEVSRNDIIYCGDVIVKLAQQILAYYDSIGYEDGAPAQHGNIKTLARGVTSVTDEMSTFIQKLFKLMQSPTGSPLYPTQEEIQCMQATLWYEQELAKQGSVENIPFLKSSIIYQVPRNENGNENGNENESDFPFVALGIGGVAVLGGLLWYISRK